MLRAKDYRNLAWSKLKGLWGTVALMAFIYALITGVCGALSRYYIGAIASFVITGPFALGFTVVSLNVIRTNGVELKQMFNGFNNFGTAFLVNLLNGIFIFLWSLLLIVPGIIKSFAYSMTYYVLADNPSMTATEARKRSIELMRGNKWRLFCLQFSFIGWWLLCGLTLGILSFWITPYLQTATAEFYQSLLPEQTEERAEESFGSNGLGGEI